MDLMMMERIGDDRKKWKDLVDRPKPTVGCSARGRRRRKRRRRIFSENICVCALRTI
jgi:hypothetical protein